MITAATATRTPTEITALRARLAAGERLFFAVPYRKRDVPVALWVDVGAVLVRWGKDEPRPLPDWEIAALVHGRLIPERVWGMRVGAMVRGRILYDRCQRLETTASRYGYASAEDEFRAKSARARGRGAAQPNPALEEAVKAVEDGRRAKGKPKE